MLVGTGAQIALLKQHLIRHNISINTDRTCEITGITTGSINTVGSVELAFHNCLYGFQLAPEETQLNEDCLIGLHFEGFYNPL
jgi:hypothetical protein